MKKAQSFEYFIPNGSSIRPEIDYGVEISSLIAALYSPGIASSFAFQETEKVPRLRGLFELAAKLEEACEKNDRIFIASHTDELLKLYTSFKEKLGAIEES